MSRAEITENSKDKGGTDIVAGDEGSPVPTLRRPITEGRLHSTGDNYQEQSSNGIDKNAEGLLEYNLEKQTNSVDHSLQHAEEQNQLHDNMEINEMSSDDASSESDSDSSSGSESDKELGKYFYPSFEESENARPLEVRMKFPTLDVHAHGQQREQRDEAQGEAAAEGDQVSLAQILNNQQVILSNLQELKDILQEMKAAQLEFQTETHNRLVALSKSVSSFEQTLTALLSSSP